MKIALIAIIPFLLACGGDFTREDLLPEASGAHGEILVLMSDGLWDGPIGKTVESRLNDQAEGVYLRPEPAFNYFRKDPDDLNHVNKLSRLILKVMIDYDSTYQETAVLEKPNYFAKNQLFLIIKDSDINRLNTFIQNDFSSCIDLMNAFELDQLINIYKKDPNKGVNQAALSKFGIGISIPDQSELKVDKDNFIWVKRERSKNLIGNQSNNTKGGTYWIQQGIVFWSEPYTSPDQMTVESVLQKRDTILKYNIPGKVEGSYMATEYTPFYDPKGEIIEYDGQKTVRIQGLWRHAGHEAAFGGGPFLQHTFVHPTNGQIITVCGYVYAPKFNKREYLREIDAMLRTIYFQN